MTTSQTYTAPSLTSTTLRERREALVRAHVEAENRHDVDATIATFHHACYDVVPFGVVCDGAPAVHELLSGLMAGFPDFAAHIETYHHADNAVIVEGHFTGTHDGPWAGLEATGRKVDLRLCAVFDFDEDRMLCERVYFDVATLRQQVGAD